MVVTGSIAGDQLESVAYLAAGGKGSGTLVTERGAELTQAASQAARRHTP